MPYCSNCGHEISAEAVMCPQCGHPGPGRRSSVSIDFGPVVDAPFATWGSRVGAYLIDLIIIFAVIAVLFGVGVGALGLGEAAVIGGGYFLALGGVVTVASVVYKPVMEGARGQTLGKMAVGIKVARATDGGDIGYGEAFLRWLIAAVIGFVPFGGLVDVLWPLWDDHKQALHDKAAKTIVVKVTG